MRTVLLIMCMIFTLSSNAKIRNGIMYQAKLDSCNNLIPITKPVSCKVYTSKGVLEIRLKDRVLKYKILSFNINNNTYIWDSLDSNGIRYSIFQSIYNKNLIITKDPVYCIKVDIK